MIPSTGPQDTDSYGEKRIYDLLRQGLSDDFTVIHSLPWLAQGIKEIDPGYPPTGEIDFLIIHRSLGVLALEVKSGKQRVKDGLFIYVKTGGIGNHVAQTRKNAHGLARWLGIDPSLRWRMGYGLIFPDSVFGDSVISPGLVDTTVSPAQALFIDRMHLEESVLADRVCGLMTYWKQTLGNLELGRQRMNRLVEVLCPTFDGTPSWGKRVEYDNRIWLRLTHEQASVVQTAMVQARMVITGWPGTGKTLIAVEIARRMIRQGKRVLMLTFNALLVEHLRKEIDSATMAKVATWHGFCSDYARKGPGQIDGSSDWLERGCFEDLQKAQENGQVPDFDVLVLDEAQALRHEWCTWLAEHFINQPIVVFCDETQRFSFEKDRISTQALCEVFRIECPYVLTIPLRSPRSVFERLQKVRLPSHQMVCPRDLETDTLQELVVGKVSSSVDDVIEDLMSRGINQTDIVVLSRFGWIRNRLSVGRYETVARFRGMEAPVIIIAGADDMDDVELFCAYSRATTVCIALYEAESLGCKLAYGKFQSLVLDDAGNADIVATAKEEGFTGSILDRYVESSAVGLTSVALAWCEDWKCWFVNRYDDAEAADLWIDYLLAYHSWPVYSWTSTSRRKIKREDPMEQAALESPRTETYELAWCNVCKTVTPQLDRIGKALVCQCCESVPKATTALPEDIFTTLRGFDFIITSSDPGSIPRKIREQLPLPLAALGARLYASAKLDYIPPRMRQLPGSSVLHRLASAFIYSRIGLRPVGAEILRDTLARDTGRYVFPIGLSQDEWRQAIARCLGQSAKAGLLKKQRDGVFYVTESEKEAAS
ncbi:hypothetical protein B0920_02995 [Massilia sp. KIM]|nr:hypothetical protein B0920_02995 [Massilia sp. KIM]